MGEIRFVGTGETRGYPYLVCKKRFVGTGETRGYPSLSGMQEIIFISTCIVVYTRSWYFDRIL